MPRKVTTVAVENVDIQSEWRKLLRRKQVAGHESDRALHVLRVAEVQDRILACLNVRDICSFGQTHRTLRGAPARHLDHSFNVLLNKFFDEVEQFRDVMRRLHAVISGSTALSFISRDPWEAGDIDLYCPLGTADVICKYLCAAEGYDEAETVWDSPYSQVQGIEKVFKVRKFDPRHGTRSIDVIESINTMAVHPITHFHITAVMNYLFADGIVVLYPELTFKRIAVKSAKPNTRHPPYSKYKDRNYTICNMGRDGLICRTACELLQRTPQDAASLALRFRSSDTPMPTLGYWTLSQDRPLPESITPLEAPECYNYLCNKRKFIPVRP